MGRDYHPRWWQRSHDPDGPSPARRPAPRRRHALPASS